MSACSKTDKQSFLCIRMQCSCVTGNYRNDEQVREMLKTGAGRTGVKVMTEASICTDRISTKKQKEA